jgi:hypothetical protein
MLNAAHRPWLSIDVYADVGTGPKVINITSVLRNHGTVPGTVTRAVTHAVQADTMLAQGFQLACNQVPAQLCIFPRGEAELAWGFPNTDAAPWLDGFIRLKIHVTYQGVFDKQYETRLEVSFPRPDGNLLRRSAKPMDVVRAEPG